MTARKPLSRYTSIFLEVSFASRTYVLLPAKWQSRPENTEFGDLSDVLGCTRNEQSAFYKTFQTGGDPVLRASTNDLSSGTTSVLKSRQIFSNRFRARPSVACP